MKNISRGLLVLAMLFSFVTAVYANTASFTNLTNAQKEQMNELGAPSSITTSRQLMLGNLLDELIDGGASSSFANAPLADLGTTNNAFSLAVTSPADTTGTNVHQALSLTMTIGNATAGTNTVNGIAFPAVTGDAQVTLNAIKIGALSGTAATEYAVNVGSGWDSGIYTASPLTNTSTTDLQGAVTLDGAVTIGDAVTDITTFTGKIAGATPLTFDGTTADTVYTIFAITDPTSSSKTITFPAATGTVKLIQAATTVITAGATPTITVPAGVDFLATDTITTDNQDQTLTFSSGGTAGQHCTLIFQTDSGGSGDEVITFDSTLCDMTGTLTLANLTAGRYTVSFVSDGTIWNETARTAAQS